MRKLATVREIKAIRPIDGADKIECAIVDGWECVIAKRDGFKVGDRIVYIEIDSIVPERPEFEFLRDRKFRVRTIRLRKQVSQGLVLPITVLPEGKYSLGDDVTEILGIKKYDPELEQESKSAERTFKPRNPIVKFMLRFEWFRNLAAKWKPRDAGFPDWIVKTDEERIQNKMSMFDAEKAKGTTFSVTEKLDGQSLTLFIRKESWGRTEFGVCSRNMRLKRPDNSSWWTVAKQIDAEGVLKTLLRKLGGERIVLQGEIIGSGIQGNKYNIDGYDFYAFNLIVDGKKYRTNEMRPILKALGINTVPAVDEDFKLPDDIPAMVEYAKGKSTLLNIKREGVVMRSYDGAISFKVINPDFLLAEKD